MLGCSKAVSICISSIHRQRRRSGS